MPTKWLQAHTRIAATAKKYLVVAGGHALLVVGRGLIVRVDDGIRGDTVGIVRLGPSVDSVDVRNVLEHGGAEEGEHSAVQRGKKCIIMNLRIVGKIIWLP